MSIESLMAFASTPTPRTTRNTKYEVCVYRTRTGEVVRWLPIVGTPRWESGINLNGSWQVQVSLDQRELDKDTLSALTEAWYWSFAIVQGNSIFQAGPVISESFADGGDDYTTFSGAGLWALYRQKRVLMNAARLSVSDVNAREADFAFGTTAESPRGAPIPPGRQNLSLHTIIKRLFENEQAKPGGAVPLALPAVDIAGTSVREFLASEIAYTGNKIYDITQDQAGPELELWPEFTSTDRSSIRHVVTIGNPRIGRLDYPHAWSYRKALTQLGLASDGSRKADRVWDKGAGFDRNVRFGFAENLDGITSGSFQQRPLLESIGQNHAQEDNSTVLNGYASATLTTGRTPDLNLDVEVTMEGDAGDGKEPPSPTFDSVRNGDTGRLLVSGHPRLRDGVYSVRVLKMGSGSGPKRGKLTVDVLGAP